MIDITPILEALVSLAAAILVVFVIPYIKANTTEQQREELLAWIKIAVAAAEQIYNGPGRGEEKKQYVLDFLAEQGVAVDDEAVNAAIEAAVAQINGVTIE